MKIQRYFPVRIGDQVVWLHHFENRLPEHAAALELDAEEVETILLDVRNGIYALRDYRGALVAATAAAHQCIENAVYGRGLSGEVMWVGFTPPGDAPAAVANGCLRRVFDFIGDKIKTAPGYNMAVGVDLGVEPGEKAAPSATVVPEFSLRLTSGGRLEVVWKKGVFDAVKLQFDLGEAGVRTDMDLRPNYTLDWLPPAGQAVVVRVRVRYVYKGEEYGVWSNWLHQTLTGV